MVYSENVIFSCDADMYKRFIDHLITNLMEQLQPYDLWFDITKDIIIIDDLRKTGWQKEPIQQLIITQWYSKYMYISSNNGPVGKFLGTSSQIILSEITLELSLGWVNP